MKRSLVLMGLAAGVAGFDQPAVAVDFGLGLLKRRQATRPDPAARAKALIVTLQSDTDDGKRKAAAEELRGLDPRNHPDIVSALATSLQRDPSPEVRIQAADSIGKLKPVSQPAGLALEAALGSDPDAKVREAVKSALWQYHLNGYKTAAAAPAGQSAEPAFAPAPSTTSTSAKPAVPTGGPVTFQPITTGVGKPPAFTPSPEPPLARPKPSAPVVVPPTPVPAVAPTPPPATGVPLPEIPVPATFPPQVPSKGY